MAAVLCYSLFLSIIREVIHNFISGNFNFPELIPITNSYFSSCDALMSLLFSININRIKIYPIRLLPSINGWLIIMLSIIADALSTMVGYSSF